MTPRPVRLVLPLALSALALSACAGQTGSTPSSSGGSASSSSQPGSASGQPSSLADQPQEQAGAKPRLVATYDGGLAVFDAETLAPVSTQKLEGFNRINPAGDGRHVFVSTSKGFSLFDAGTWGKPHGDHSHFYTAAPAMTPATVPAEHPGHVVVHEGFTALFADGTGTTTLLDPASLTKDAEDGTLTPKASVKAPEAHHGVAVPLPGGGLLTTKSKGEDRVGISVYDSSLTKVAVSSDQCPGTHGESTTQGEAVVVGCEDGVLVYKDGKITKIKAPGGVGRIGNQAGSPVSPISLGDFKTELEKGTLEHPTKISLIDTRTMTMKVVDLPASYTFRSLGRGAHGEALVLGTDGTLRILDPESGKVLRSVKVTGSWTEPEDWQKPRPTLFVQGEHAYVSDPIAKKLHRIGIESGTIEKSADVEQQLNELTGVTGKAPGHEGDSGGAHQH